MNSPHLIRHTTGHCSSCLEEVPARVVRDAEEAHAVVARNETVGKVVLRVP